MFEYLIAFGAGLISFLSPCVLPLIPGYVSYISGQSLQEIIESKKTNFFPLVLFCLGFSTVFVLLGASASFLGQALLQNSEILRIVVNNIKENNIKNLVVDPVMVASSGDRLLNDQAIDDYRKFLIPLAKIITPNIPEAETLSGVKIKNFEDIKINSRILFQMGCEYVLIKGGHLNEEYSIDYLYDGKNLLEFSER